MKHNVLSVYKQNILNTTIHCAKGCNSSNTSQLTPSTDINQLSISEIVDYMKTQFDPTQYIVRERYKFWSDLKRTLGETIPELAARIRQDAVTCGFTTITDPQDEALRTCFICSVNNEAVLKALFRMEDDELTFAKAVAVAQETGCSKGSQGDRSWAETYRSASYCQEETSPSRHKYT